MSDYTVIETTSLPHPPAARRFFFLYGLLVLAVAVLIGRTFFLQVLQGSRFLSLAEGNRVSVVSAPAPRGIVYDHFGTQLVENIASTDVILDPRLLPGEEDESPLIELLPILLNLSADEVRAAIQTARQSQRITILDKAIDHDIVLKLEEMTEKLPGIQLTSSLVRQYPYGEQTAHVIGYTGPVSAEEIQERNELLPTDITGKTGIEKQYDETLKGTHGAAYLEVDAAGHTQKELGQQESTPGSALKLALDIELQSYIFQLFADRQQEQEKERQLPVSGAVVALDPTSGALRALVSYPSFDPNTFSQPSRAGTGATLFQSPLQPLFNRSVDGEYPPGSTIKPLLAAAALQEGVITPQTTVVSSGKITVGPWEFPDWKAGGHGVTDLNKAIAESVNTFFYLLSGGDDTHQGLGVVRIKTYLEKFGWGNQTGVDLPSEAAGFLPSPEWKEKAKHEQWYIGDTYHLGIGQGDVLASPLQLAAATAAIANGGTWFEPFIVESSTAPHRSISPHTPSGRRLPVQATHIQRIQEAMRHTVTEGSGRALASLPLALAGKTGTAQIGGREETHAWFTSFGPAESPELVITVLLEQGGEGDKDAVPFAKNIWEWWIEHRSNL